MQPNKTDDHMTIRRVHVYTRRHQAHAWKYQQTSLYEAALLARDVNDGFGVTTLLVPDAFAVRPWLHSCQSQTDFNLDQQDS
jgi:hypothetical protein